MDTTQHTHARKERRYKGEAPASFIGKSGRFYVSCPEGWAINPRYAVRESEEAYNQRNGLIGFMPAAEALADFGQEIKIYSESLTTTPPVYPVDRDETDLGLTPPYDIWAERFARGKGVRRYAT